MNFYLILFVVGLGGSVFVKKSALTPVTGEGNKIRKDWKCCIPNK